MRSGMSTSVRLAKNSALIGLIQLSDNFAIGHEPKTAITARSKPSVPRVSRDVAFVVVWMNSIWIGSEATTRRSLTRKPYVNGRSGSSRYLPKVKTGMACGAFVCDGSGASTVRLSCEQEDKILNACSRSAAGGGVHAQQRRCMLLFLSA